VPVEFEGEFEAHITVRADDRNGTDAVRAWADQRGLKFHHIVLARGRNPSQPMVTFRHQGELSQVRLAVDVIAAELLGDGFTVARVKIEAHIGNREVPESDAEAASHADRYFEHHVKLVLEPHTDLTNLTEIVIRHSAHLSRNARRVRDDGREERFVTQRCFSAGRITAGKRCEELEEKLNRTGYAIVSVEREYVVLDSAPQVDAGWLVAEDEQ
jgi:hypothetical protein